MADKDIKPQTGRTTDSSLTSMLKKLQKSRPEGNMPKLPGPTFDKLMGGLFKERKK